MTSMNDTIQWGILAPGRIAHKFAQDLQLAEGNKLHAVASRSLDRAKEFSSRYGAEFAYGSYEELLDCPGLDVVYIASPHSGHFDHAMMCLKNKIPVLCEKPLAINLKQVQQMAALARSNETFLMEAIWTRFIPVFEKAVEMIKSGTIGGLKTVRADFGFRADFPPEHRLFNLSLGGGSLLDVGMYPVFAALTVLGKPDTIQAAATFGPTGADESCGMLFRYHDQRLALLDSSIVVNTDTTATFYGEKGTIHLHKRFHQADKMSVHFYGGQPERIEIPYTGIGYYHEIMEVSDCLRSNKTESDKLPLHFSLSLMETLDEVRRAAGIVYEGID